MSGREGINFFLSSSKGLNANMMARDQAASLYHEVKTTCWEWWSKKKDDEDPNEPGAILLH